jgi:hypothetical protein
MAQAILWTKQMAARTKTATAPRTGTIAVPRVFTAMRQIAQQARARAAQMPEAVMLPAPVMPILVAQPAGGVAFTPGPSAQAAYDEADGVAEETQGVTAGLPPIALLAILGAVAFLVLGKARGSRRW